MATAQRIIMGGAAAASAAAEPRGGKVVLPPADLGWALLGWVGAVFLVIGLVDLSLGWITPHFGNPEWEFGTIARTLDSLPITVLGLALVLAATAERRVVWAVRAASLVAWVLAIGLLVLLAVFLLDVPVALKATVPPELKAGLYRAVAKALVQGLLYPTVLAAIGWQGVRATRRARIVA